MQRTDVEDGTVQRRVLPGGLQMGPVVRIRGLFGDLRRGRAAEDEDGDRSGDLWREMRRVGH